ncbi:MAG: MBL fold metallo-hydrolase [Microcoleaceae cyanobacterium]
MAQLQKRRTENIKGNFYVDQSCIDCDACRWIAPEIFNRQAQQSAVFHQPATTDEELQAMQALLSCPTASIGTVEKPTAIKTAQQSLPALIEDSVYYCGYHSEKSFGAASYLIRRPQGNILVDSPRFSPPLVRQLEQLGGIRYHYLTHRDDIADHQKFHDHFGCDRLLHQTEITAETRSVEIQLSGDEPIELAPDLLIIPVPGHSPGHTVLLYDQKFLFTGDHLAWSEPLGQLYAFRRYCWYSWTEQLQSMKKLLNYRFEWVLPGHGRRHHADPATMHQELSHCIEWMTRQ